MAIKQVAYTELFLTKRALKQFKPYLTKVQLNGLNTTNIVYCSILNLSLAINSLFRLLNIYLS